MYSLEKHTCTEYIHYVNILYRNDGIIISISVWQVIVEAIFNITYIAWNIFLQPTLNNLGISKVSMTLFLLFFSYIILPSFYFLADPKFRSALKESGIMKAIWSALKQKYDWSPTMSSIGHVIVIQHYYYLLLWFLLSLLSKNV